MSIYNIAKQTAQAMTQIGGDASNMHENIMSKNRYCLPNQTQTIRN